MPRRNYSTATPSDTLIDGVPDYMANSVDPWIELMVSEPIRPGSQMRVAKQGTILRIERKLRRSLGGNSSRQSMLANFMAHLNQNEELKLDAIQALLEMDGNETKSNLLDMVLLESGSKWSARKGTDDMYGLEERVESITTSAYDELIEHDPESLMSNFLAQAWEKAFGRDPDPSIAYSNAIKALEAATWPLVLPNNSRATLGDIIRELDNHKDEWQSAITETTSNIGIESVIDNLKLVWQGQTDRHGTASPVPPSQQAAEQAVFTAIHNCQLMARGLVNKVEAS